MRILQLALCGGGRGGGAGACGYIIYTYMYALYEHEATQYVLGRLSRPDICNRYR